jgi:hypothetical protein
MQSPQSPLSIAPKPALTKLLTATLLSATVLTACASAPNVGSAPQVAAAIGQQESAPANSASKRADLESELAQQLDPAKPTETRATPQLIKTATIDLEVEDTAKTIKAITQIVRSQRGDILNLQSDSPQDSNTTAQASLSLRVPQERLDLALTDLAKLGKVLRQGIKAEDVSSQLVDADARLRNLRKAEEATLKILDRSGSVSDVLKVSQEVSKIREQIEQIDAQLKALKGSVAYSTIDVTLASAVSALVPQKGLGSEVLSAWNGATRSSQGFGRGLLVLGIWFLAYSPFWLALGGGVWLARRSLWRAKTSALTGASTAASTGALASASAGPSASPNTPGG